MTSHRNPRLPGDTRCHVVSGRSLLGFLLRGLKSLKTNFECCRRARSTGNEFKLLLLRGTATQNRLLGHSAAESICDVGHAWHYQTEVGLLSLGPCGVRIHHGDSSTRQILDHLPDEVGY